MPLRELLHNFFSGRESELAKAEPIREAQPVPETVEEDEEQAKAPAGDPFRDFMDGIAALDGLTWLNATIAGVTHKNVDGNSRQRYVHELTFLDQLQLERERDNPHSNYAVKILNEEGYQLGYVPEWIARDVAKALDSGGIAVCYVQHARQTSSTNYAVAIGVAWRAKLSPRNEFRQSLDRRADVEEWFWAIVSGVDAAYRQETIATLMPGQKLTLQLDGSKRAPCILLSTGEGAPVAVLRKQHSEIVQAGWADGRTYEAIVFEVRERSRGKGLEPVVAVLLLKE